jgi:hypothetical protein
VAEEVLLGSERLEVVQQGLVDYHLRVKFALPRELPHHPPKMPVGHLAVNKSRAESAHNEATV